MANQVSVDAITIRTYNGNRTPAFVGALPSRSFTDLSGQFIGGGNARTVDKDWFVKTVVRETSDGVYTSDPFTGADALSATRWSGVDQGVTWNFYLLDSRLNIIKTLYQNIVISDYLTTTSIEDAEMLSRARYFPRTTSYVNHDELQVFANGLDLAPDATTLVKGKGLHSRTGTNTFVSDNDTRVADDLSKHGDSLATAVSNIAILGNPERRLAINSIDRITADLVVPSNIKLDPQNGGMIQIAPGVELTVELMNDAGNTQVFDLEDNTATVKFANGAVPHLNTAWIAGAANDADITQALDNLIASATLFGGGICKILIPQLAPYTRGGHVLGNGTTIVGKGNYPTAAVGFGTTLRMKADSTEEFMFKVGEAKQSGRFRNIILSANGVDADGVLFEGTGGSGTTAADFEFNKVTLAGFRIGIKHNSLGSSWQLAQVSFKQCIFQGCAISVQSNSVNSLMTFDTTCGFSIPLNGIGLNIISSGIIKLNGCEFGGGGYSSKVMVISGSHGGITFDACQSENCGTIFQNDASDESGIVNIVGGSIMQGKCQINQSMTVNIRDSVIMSHYLQGAPSGGYAHVENCFIREVAEDGVGGTIAVVPAVLSTMTGGMIVATENLSTLGKHITRLPQKFANKIDGAASTPQVFIGNYSTIAENKVQLWIGQMDANEQPLNGYGIKRNSSTGYLDFLGSQAGFTAFNFNGAIFTVDDAYDATTWNGNLSVPVKNAVRDQIETILASIAAILDGADFTGAITAPSIAVGSGGTAITKVVKGTVNINFADLAADTVATETVTLTGAAVGDTVILNPPAAGLTAGLLILQAFVSAANTVSIVVLNHSGGNINEGAADWNYVLIRS